jgi:hypothetical protein
MTIFEISCYFLFFLSLSLSLFLSLCLSLHPSFNTLLYNKRNNMADRKNEKRVKQILEFRKEKPNKECFDCKQKVRNVVALVVRNCVRTWCDAIKCYTCVFVFCVSLACMHTCITHDILKQCTHIFLSLSFLNSLALLNS